MTSFGSVTGNVIGPVQFSGGHVSFSQGSSGAGVQVVKGSQIWYVDKNSGLGSSGDGLSWDKAFLTVTEAIAAAGNYDIIFIGQGVYDEATYPLVITQTGLKIIGAGSSGYNWGPCSLKSSSSTETIMEIDASQVEIAGLGFNLYTDAKAGIVVGASATVYKTHIHDCFFGCSAAGNAEGEVGIAIGCDETGAQGSFDAVDTHVERCGFHYLATAAISVYGTRTKINDCMIWSNSSGIDFTATGVNRACNMAINNYLIARGGAGTGIKIASTEPTDGTLLVAHNAIANFGTANITAGKGDAGTINNTTYADGGEGYVDCT